MTTRKYTGHIIGTDPRRRTELQIALDERYLQLNPGITEGQLPASDSHRQEVIKGARLRRLQGTATEMDMDLLASIADVEENSEADSC